jgi:1,2-diacylglycerol 3-alpha-glucosyltransferase
MKRSPGPIAVLFDRLGPYHVARLRAAAKMLDIICIELSADTSEYMWDRVDASGVRRVTLFPDGESRLFPAHEVRNRVAGTLNKFKPKVVAIPGWSHRGAHAALAWCIRTGTPAVLMSASTAHDEIRRWSKEWIKSRMVRLFKASLVGGKSQADYVKQLGFSDEAIFVGYDVVDNEFFQNEAHAARVNGDQLRASLQLRPNYFLASARFIPKKNHSFLLDAYERYLRAESAHSSTRAAPWQLVLLGDGALKDDMVSAVERFRLKDHVLMPGFKQYAELPAYYGLASAFVLPSTTEQWGLVVNEAMASGLPVLVSNRCGCAPDLVQGGINGFTHDPYNVEQLTELMIRMAAMHPTARSAMGDASRRIISEWGPERFARGLKQGVDKALEVGRSQTRLLDRMLIRALMLR